MKLGDQEAKIWKLLFFNWERSKLLEIDEIIWHYWYWVHFGWFWNFCGLFVDLESLSLALFSGKNQVGHSASDCFQMTSNKQSAYQTYKTLLRLYISIFVRSLVGLVVKWDCKSSLVSIKNSFLLMQKRLDFLDLATFDCLPDLLCPLVWLESFPGT